MTDGSCHQIVVFLDLMFKVLWYVGVFILGTWAGNSWRKKP